MSSNITFKASGSWMVVLFGLLTSAKPVPAEVTVQQIFDLVNPAVVKVDTPDAFGSGFITSPDGIVVTNYHVIRNARKVTVQVLDGRTYREYPVIGVVEVDSVNDYAVLKIAASGLPSLRLGNPNAAKVGERVVAIGNPRGYEHTVSDGIISQKREFDGRQLLQISNEIDHGSSGGPLVNMKGEVLGITTLARNGFNFAVPISYVRFDASHRIYTLDEVAEAEKAKTRDIIASNFAVYEDPASGFRLMYPKAWKVERCSYTPAKPAWTGVTKTRFLPPSAVKTACEALLDEGVSVEFGFRRQPSDFNLDTWIEQFVDGRAAQPGFAVTELPHARNFAGLRARTIGIEDSKRNIIEESILAWHPPDYTLSIVFRSPSRSYRDNKSGFDVMIEAFQLLDPKAGGNSAITSIGSAQGRRFGMRLSVLSAPERETLKVRWGLRLDSIDRDSFAASIGLRCGDVIVSVNGQPTLTNGDVWKFRDSLAAGAVVEFEIVRRAEIDGLDLEPERLFLSGRFNR